MICMKSEPGRSENSGVISCCTAICQLKIHNSVSLILVYFLGKHWFPGYKNKERAIFYIDQIHCYSIGFY